MSAPQVYLKHRDGSALGPLSARDLEVLFDGRMIDERTPVSTDGRSYRDLGAWPALLSRLEDVKARVSRGEDPWAEPDPGAPEEHGDPARGAAPSPGPGLDIEAKPLLRVLLELALTQSTGRLRLQGGGGEVTLTSKEGKVVLVETDIGGLTLPRFLLAEGVVSPAALVDAEAKAPSFGGDLGGTLIATGVVPPHVYFEKLIAWATSVVGGALAQGLTPVGLELGEVPPPPVPLGFDRFGLLTDAVRRGLDRAALAERLQPKRGCVLIPSQVEGASVEQCKLLPRELRALNAVDGVKSLGDLLDTMGSGEDGATAVLRAVYFATEAGFVVFGEDPRTKQEAAAKAELEKLAATLGRQNHFQRLNVTEKNSDDEVRARYGELAKRHHPDTLPAGSSQSLIDARRRVFELVSESFAALETEDQRYRYSHDLEHGLVGGTDDLQKVQNALQAETLFRKAEVLLRVRKYTECLEHLDQAMALAPGETEFKVYRAWATYLANARGGNASAAAQSAIKEILTFLKSDANIASGYLFLGHLHKALDKQDVALRYFEKVLEYQENHPEAIREVRVANMRKEKQKKKSWL